MRQGGSKEEMLLSFIMESEGGFFTLETETLNMAAARKTVE